MADVARIYSRLSRRGNRSAIATFLVLIPENLSAARPAGLLGRRWLNHRM